MIEYEELGDSIVREGLAQLLRDPGARRMSRDIAVQNATTIVADDEEAVEHSKPQRRHGEEIHGGDGFAMITQKRQPTFGRLRAPGCSPHPAGDGGFRDLETEHKKLAVDMRRTPGGVLHYHLEDQLSGLL